MNPVAMTIVDPRKEMAKPGNEPGTPMFSCYVLPGMSSLGFVLQKKKKTRKQSFMLIHCLPFAKSAGKLLALYKFDACLKTILHQD